MTRPLDVNQAAKRLGVSSRTVYRLIESGDIPASRRGTKHCIRIEEDELRRFQQERADAEPT